ncbi:MAG TPA: YncE family protein, partial [Ilumatobacteraceae bacterium]
MTWRSNRRPPRCMFLTVGATVLLTIAAGACSSASTAGTTTARSTASASSVEGPATETSPPPTTSGPATTAPPFIAASTTSSTAPATTTTLFDVYSHTGVGQMSPAVANAKAYVYVPSNSDGSVTVIDQQTMTVVKHYNVGRLVQHVVAGWDLTKLYATASGSNRLVEIDPATGDKGASIRVAAPYNLYFTPDGSTAIVMAERLNRMDFYDRLTWKLRFSVRTPCTGINHADWSVDGAWFMATCEFSGQLLKVDTATGEILGVVPLAKGAMPQDIRLAPDGTKFYVADMEHNCVWIVDGDGTTVTGSIETGVGTHGIYPSRDGTLMYVTNRGRMEHDTHRRSRPGDGSVSVIDPRTDTVVATWQIPDGGSPDMGGVSA